MEAFPSLTPSEFNNACRTLEERCHDNLDGTEWVAVEFKLHSYSYSHLRSHVTSTEATGHPESLRADGGCYSDDEDGDEDEDKDGNINVGEMRDEGQGQLVIRVRRKLASLRAGDDDTKNSSIEAVAAANDNGKSGHQSLSIKEIDEVVGHNNVGGQLEAELLDDEEDTDALLRHQARHQARHQTQHPSSTTSSLSTHPHQVVEFSIVLSPTYRVPVLWFSFPDSPSVRTEDLQQVYTHVVTPHAHKVLSKVGVMGGISIANHPITDRVCYFIHPCNTPDALRSMVPESSTLSPFDYLLLWFGIVGSAVGLYIPSQLVTS